MDGKCVNDFLRPLMVPELRHGAIIIIYSVVLSFGKIDFFFCRLVNSNVFFPVSTTRTRIKTEFQAVFIEYETYIEYEERKMMKRDT